MCVLAGMQQQSNVQPSGSWWADCVGYRGFTNCNWVSYYDDIGYIEYKKNIVMQILPPYVDLPLAHYSYQQLF